MLVVIDVLEYLRDAGGYARAGYGGLVAGVLHHLFIQYPRQTEICTTIYASLAGNIGFAGLLWYILNNPSVGTVLPVMGLFDLIYVFSSVFCDAD